MSKMASPVAVRILEADANKRGDLLCRLMTDLFVSLGYDQVRLNVARPGREIDIQANHRTEPRCAIGECKATEAKSGGDDVNKFIGVLDVEKRKLPGVDVTGYFISLSGFTETAIEQETEAGGTRIVTLDGKRVVEELVKGRIVTSQSQAAERAGRCAANLPTRMRADTECELLAHRLGWVWAVYFSRNKERTHFALVHADGDSLSSRLAEQVVESDASVGGVLRSLNYLPPPDDSIAEDAVDEAMRRYRTYLAAECGEVTLEGLPADQDVGSRRLNLEHIFVPLHVQPVLTTQPETELRGVRMKGDEIFLTPGRGDFMSEPQAEPPEQTQPERELVGKVLSDCSRLAILAAPGGGKTTLVKRLVTAYAFPERRELVDDGLPSRDWLPLLIRCRQLGDNVRRPFSEILRGIAARAEMDNQSEAFAALVGRSLQSGEALLLVDGLDEIANEGARVSFVAQLRAFLATYPSISAVITSREAGFRIIGGALSAHCAHYRLADFDNDDITRLTLAWHKEVVGDRPDVETDARKLAQAICDTDRVRRLARNPLLLTTLLLVKRWVGQLPTRRSVLYGKAIEVLLMTWNVEGYEPIDQDEAVPQLAFAAFRMMKDGVQRITLKRLEEILTQARTQMPEVLGYARLSVSEFIRRIELRSSLLVQSGHALEDGTLYPTYEFLHLTFQEYLAAKAAVDGHYPGRRDGDDLLAVLGPFMDKGLWREVIPLAAVLAGRRVQPFIADMIRRLRESAKVVRATRKDPIVSLLAQCIIDEMQVPPALLREAFEWIARRTSGPSPVIGRLYAARYGQILADTVLTAYMSAETDLGKLGSALANITLTRLGWSQDTGVTQELVERLSSMIKSGDDNEKTCGALAAMHIAYFFRSAGSPDREPTGTLPGLLGALGDAVAVLLPDPNPHVHGSACWALAWLGHTDAWAPDRAPDTIRRLVEIARRSKVPEVARFATWALSALPVVDRDAVSAIPAGADFLEFVKGRLRRPYLRIGVGDYLNREATLAALVAAYYARTPLSDEDIAAFAAGRAGLSSDRPRGRPVHLQILDHLGPAGAAALQRLKDAADKPPVKRPKLSGRARLGRMAHKRKRKE